jgi:hypothetical protein
VDVAARIKAAQYQYVGACEICKAHIGKQIANFIKKQRSEAANDDEQLYDR